MLHDPARHEALVSTAWNEFAARQWIERFADDAQRAFTSETLWPTHPRDADDGDEAPQPFAMVYFGAAGVIGTLDQLARAGLAARTVDFVPMLDALVTRNVAQVEPWGHGVEGLLMGRSGVLLLRYRLAPDRATADAIAASVVANAHHPALELLWGSPSTMHVALTMHEWTGDVRWADLFRADAVNLLRALLPAGDAPCRIWTQDLYGKKARFIGAGHGFAGNASALVRGRNLLTSTTADPWQDAIVETAHTTAMRDGTLANWPPQLVPTVAAPKMLVQWCHGAPGMVTSLANLPDARLD
ncbi:MAG: lanthionine synthetase LanC family protein, partial [Betaproteobacteria bacterium]